CFLYRLISGGVPERAGAWRPPMSRDRVQPSRLLGRRIECEELDRLLGDALAGRSQVIVLRGEAGVGKSALLRYVSEQVPGWAALTSGALASPVGGRSSFCGVRGASARARCCVMYRSRSPAGTSSQPSASSRRWRWPTAVPISSP